MGCSALLCCRFDDSQESRFQASKRSNLSSAVLESVHCANIHEIFSSCKNSDIVCAEQQWGLFADSQELHFRSRKIQIIAVTTYKGVDFLIFTNFRFGVGNFEICAVLSSNEFDLLMLRNSVFRQRTDQKCAVQTRKDL